MTINQVQVYLSKYKGAEIIHTDVDSSYIRIRCKDNTLTSIDFTQAWRMYKNNQAFLSALNPSYGEDYLSVLLHRKVVNVN